MNFHQLFTLWDSVFEKIGKVDKTRFYTENGVAELNRKNWNLMRKSLEKDIFIVFRKFLKLLFKIKYYIVRILKKNFALFLKKKKNKITVILKISMNN